MFPIIKQQEYATNYLIPSSAVVKTRGPTFPLLHTSLLSGTCLRKITSVVVNIRTKLCRVEVMSYFFSAFTKSRVIPKKYFRGCFLLPTITILLIIHDLRLARLRPRQIEAQLPSRCKQNKI